ncbi:O-antigen ligase family protein [Stieleria sp. JC731]|uniref:O-antigen ligase family protein n=1 Tax=Pirellulaceae TaxID=2691357 RepID=UPI001E37B5A6|nr:O-antigen ligase family protein [Stieleria sp. JC731]MCC9600659.1 O-antigen ligase family protein [Stieleria sp. JC731]
MNVQPSTPPLTVGARLRTQLRIVPVAIVVVGFLAAFLNPIQPVSDSRVSPTNPVLLLKLLGAASAWGIGLWGVLRSATMRQMLGRIPAITLLCLAGVFILAGIVSPSDSRTISVAAALILLGYLLFILATLSTIGFENFARVLLLGLAVYLFLAWGVFLLWPSFGQFHEYVDATTTVARMGGVSHPNAIAHEASTAILIALAFWRGNNCDDANRRSFYWLCTIAIVLAAVTLLATISRTAMLATAAAAVMLFFDKLYSRLGAVLAVGIAIVGLGFVGVVGLTSTDATLESLAGRVTKSGDVEELTSFTGRTDIWQEAIGWISQRPLVGYGMDSAASVMSSEAVGTHNLLLHVIFSGGIVAGALMLVLLLATLVIAFSSHQPLLRGIATYVLVSGLVEDTLLPSFPCALTLLWAAILMATQRVQSPPSQAVNSARIGR